MTNYLSSRLYHLEQQAADFKAQQRRELFQSFAETLVASGKISRNDQLGLVDFLVSLPDGTGADFFQRFLSDRPKVAEFSETPELQSAFANARRQYEAGWRNRT